MKLPAPGASLGPAHVAAPAASARVDDIVANRAQFHFEHIRVAFTLLRIRRRRRGRDEGEFGGLGFRQRERRRWAPVGWHCVSA